MGETNQKSLKLNFIMNAILTMSSFVFPLLTIPYVTRIIMPVGTGKVSFAASIISYFAMFAQLGVPTYGIRACAKVRDDRSALTRTVQEILIINVGTCIVAYIGFLIALLVVPRLGADRNLFLIMSLSIVLNTIGVEWMYKGLEQYTYITIRSIVFKCIAMLGIFALVHSPEDYVVYGGLTLFAASASNFLNFINVHRYISLRPVGKYEFKKHLKPIAVFFAMACATTVYTNLDVAMLGFMKTDTDVGYYDAAVRIKNVLVGLVTSLGAVLLPRASYYVEQKRWDKFREITKTAIRFVFLLAMPLLLYFMLFAKETIMCLSGEAYEGAIVPMMIIMPTLLLIGLTNIMGFQILVPLGKERYVLYSVAAGAVIDLIINILLIPKMASAGAAIGTLVAEVVVWVFQVLVLRNHVKEAYLQVDYWKIVIALVAGVVSSLWVKQLSMGDLGVLVIAVVLFMGSYLLMLNILRESLVLELEKQLLKKLHILGGH